MFKRLNNVQKTSIFLRRMNCTLTTTKRGFCFKSPFQDENNNNTLKKSIVNKPLVETFLHRTQRAVLVASYVAGSFYMSFYSVIVAVTEKNPLPLTGTIFVGLFIAIIAE